jgi:uncharacterized alkaline shock family protein YloU
MSKPLVLAGPHGRIEITLDALETLVVGAVADVEHVALARGRRAVELDTAQDGLGASVAVTVRAGEAMPDVGERVQRSVAKALKGMTGRPATVDVTVVGVDG